MDPVEREPWWHERRAFVLSRPSAEGMRRLARVVSRGSTPLRVRRLGGGLSTATNVVTLRTPRGRTVDVIVKRFPPGREAVATNEWKQLGFAERIAVPTPEPIAFDRRGDWFGATAIVMSKLPGRPDVAPKDTARWLAEFAEVQAAIHSTSVAHAPASARAGELVAQPVPGLVQSDETRAAMNYIARRLAKAATRDVVVGHGDAHPGNVLWARGRISGVVDWSHGGVLPRGHEVAYARADIAVLAGPSVADRYLAVYERTSGTTVPDLAVWDLRQGIAAVRWNAVWAHAYREQGAELTTATARRRARSFFRGALSRC